MELSAIGRAGREQVVGDKAGANSEADASTKLSSPRRLIGALENLGRDAWATFSTIGARGPQFAYSSSGGEKLPAHGFFPGISDEQIRKTEEEGGEVQEHQLPVLPEEQNSRLNRQAHGVAAQTAGALAHVVQQAIGRTNVNGVAHRGVEETHRGDGSIFDKAIDVVGLKWAAVGDAAEQAGLSPDEATAEGDKAIGRSDPQANFSANAVATLSTARKPLAGIALRGADSPRENNPQIDPAQADDGSSFGEVIEALEDKENDTYKGALSGGASAADAQKAADKAVGRANPKANFSADATAADTSDTSKMRRLKTALRPSRLHIASNEAGTTPRLQFPTLRTPRFA
ncbi:UNVERIFIED_ORG: hypothetical protein ABIC54_005959 [Burkholderia sp. 1263]